MSIDRGMDEEDTVHICHGCYSDIKKNEMTPSVSTRMDPDIIILRKISYDIVYMWNLKKMVEMNLLTKLK